MSHYFNRMLDKNTYDWETLCLRAPQQKSLLQSVLDKNEQEIEGFLTSKVRMHQEEINGALFAAYAMDNTSAVHQLFPYGSSAGIEAAKSCLIGSTYINNLDLFSETALWLKKKGENAMKKKDVRNHCLINFTAFNHVDKVQELFKTSKSTLKNDSAVHDFYMSIIKPAAKYGSQELIELANPVALEYFENHMGRAYQLISQGLLILASTYTMENGVEQALTTKAHNHAFEWLLNKYDIKNFYGVLQSHHRLDHEHLVEILKRYNEDDLKREIQLMTQHQNLPKLEGAYEVLCNLRQKEILSAELNTTNLPSSSRKM